MHCNSIQRTFTAFFFSSPPTLKNVLFAVVTTIDLRGIIDHGGQIQSLPGDQKNDLNESISQIF